MGRIAGHFGKDGKIKAIKHPRPQRIGILILKTISTGKSGKWNSALRAGIEPG
jgi:hypothetical protein